MTHLEKMRNMSRNTSAILMLAASLLCICSCRDLVIEIDSPEKESFLLETREGIYRRGESLFVFDSGRHQKAVNTSRIQYRIQTDIQDTCLNITLDAIPQGAGVHITTSIDYRSPGELISSMNRLECSRIETDKLWLWSPETLTGIIISREEN